MMVTNNKYKVFGTARFARGFSLVELFVVIAIIAMLAAILLPALSRARSKVDGIVCLNNSRQIGLSFLLYSEENDDLMVPYGDSTKPHGKMGPANALYWMDMLNNYANHGRAVHDCPSYVRRVPNGFGIGYSTDNVPIFGLFVEAGMEKSQLSRLSAVAFPSDSIPFADVAAVKNPSALPDAWTQTTDGTSIPLLNVDLTQFGIEFTSRLGPEYNCFFLTPRSQFWNAIANRVVNRHSGKAVATFADGHGERVRSSSIGWDKDYGDAGALWDNR